MPPRTSKTTRVRYYFYPHRTASRRTTRHTAHPNFVAAVNQQGTGVIFSQQAATPQFWWGVILGLFTRVIVSRARTCSNYCSNATHSLQAAANEFRNKSLPRECPRTTLNLFYYYYLLLLIDPHSRNYCGLSQQDVCW